MALTRHNDFSGNIENIASVIVDSILEVHKNIGPGYLEKIYEDCLFLELQSRKLLVERQKPLKMRYKEFDIPTVYYLDIVVENAIIIELKAVEKLLPVHQAQIMSYMKMADIELGFLMNFNTDLMKNGLKRIALKKTS